jgi:hypothetical protein
MYQTMQRLPFVTLSSLFLAMILLVGIAAALSLTGEELFSPGDLSAQTQTAVTLEGFSSHAQFEKECQRCHQPLQNPQGSLCVECHTVVAEEISQQMGVHSRIKNVQTCRTCHSDHKGKDIDGVQLALARFDHTQTTFRLNMHQVNFDTTPMECLACHQGNVAGLPLSKDGCVNCHTTHDPPAMARHESDFGKNCLACHDGVDRMIHFDHAGTGFALLDKHSQLACIKCHTTENLKDTPHGCSQCHAQPAVHQGAFVQECDTCHSAAGWTPAILDGKPFTHASLDSVKFTLAHHARDYNDQPLTCQGCHPVDVQHADQQTCQQCHAKHAANFMQKHLDTYGEACITCHDGVDRLAKFDHAQTYPLQGKHADAKCEDCHPKKQFANTPTLCLACHEDPAIHAGFMGTACEYCHTAAAWKPALLRKHIFQLDHGSPQPVACTVCHPKTYQEYTCFGCHDHQLPAITQSHTRAGISATDLPTCIRCHPTGSKGEYKSQGSSGTP